MPRVIICEGAKSDLGKVPQSQYMLNIYAQINKEITHLTQPKLLIP